MKDFLNQYGPSFIHSIIALFFSYITLEIKSIYQNHVNDKTKKEVVTMVCKAIEKLYPNYTGEQKLNAAIQNSITILNEKGIKISDLELRMYIESTIKEFENTTK